MMNVDVADSHTLHLHFHQHRTPFPSLTFRVIQQAEQSSADFAIKPENKEPTIDASNWPLLLKVSTGSSYTDCQEWHAHYIVK